MATLQMGEATCRAPFARLVQAGGAGALAVLVETEGPSYRHVGAVMAVDAGGATTGALSSGCIEADIAAQAAQARAEGRPRLLRYGAGSPYADLRLPCGGAMAVLVIPDPDPAPLRAVLARTAAREPVTLNVDRGTGALAVRGADAAAEPGEVAIPCPPEIRTVILGSGAEVRFFGALAAAAGWDVAPVVPAPEAAATGAAIGRPATALGRPEDWQPGALDQWTAVVLFFHDHDWEPPILARALDTRAFYIGAQGSRRAHEARLVALEAMGVDRSALARLRAPIGLIPSTRDPRSLAISVLADVCAAAPAAGPVRATAPAADAPA